MRIARSLAAAFAFALVAGCAPSHVMTNAEIPEAHKLGEVMWAQARITDPQWKKIGAASYSDADWAAFTAVGERLQMTTTKIKQSFSKGPEFDAFATTLAAHAGELLAAATAHDVKAASDALAASRATCRACHDKFR